MKYLSSLKFGQKINLSFGGLIILVAINAIIGIFTANSIAHQIAAQEQFARVAEEFTQIYDAGELFLRTRSREAAQQTFTGLDIIRRDIEAVSTDNPRLTPLLPLLDDYRLLFQKHVIETDQKAALESRSILLGRRMLDELTDTRTRRAAASDRASYDTMVGMILSLKWQERELRSPAQTLPTEQLDALRNTLDKLRDPERRKTGDIESQRRLYRILQDATDYLHSHETYLRYQTLNDETEYSLKEISNKLKAATSLANKETRETIHRRIPLSITLMLGAFFATLLCAIAIARILRREMLEPIRALVRTTQAITSGKLDERAARIADDEIGELATSFNRMSDSLRDMRDGLEERVSERTQQLAKANSALQGEITVRQQAEAEVAERERHLRTIIDLVPHFIFAKNFEGQFILANKALAEAYGTTPENLVGKTDRDFNPDEAEIAQFILGDQEVIQSGHEKRIPEEIFTDVEGKPRYMQTVKIPFDFDQNTGIQHVLGVAVDITERKQHQKQLERIAHFDALTDLPNRVLLSDRLNQAMVNSLRHGNLLAVAYLDLDGFKSVNDKFGHSLGDKLLALVARRMKQALREGDTLARLGGDEFVAVLLDLEGHETSAPILERLLAAAAEPVRIDGLELHISASLGVTYYPQSEEVDADQLMRQADQAMYQAKQSGKNRYHIFDADHDRTVRGHHESLGRIRQALFKREFVLYYQPKVNMRSGQIIGAEALIRWQHPELGLLPPSAFLPLIENNALSIDIGEWVLETALTQIEDWRRSGLSLPVSVNIDAPQFGQADFTTKLRQRLDRHPGIHPGDLELEVLETSALEDIAQISGVIQACQDIGVGFALDDFGTGYSSLTYLKRLPAKLLKVDQSFVRDMLDDPEDLAILEGVIGLAAAFRRQVIAEGVETIAHGELLLKMGCEWGQGYAIAKPMPAADISAWLANWKPDSAWAACANVGKEKLPVLYAMVEHRAWIHALKLFLATNDPAPPKPLMEQHACRFGHWLDGDGTERYSTHPAFAGIVSLHEKIHHQGQALLALKSSGQDEAALSDMVQLELLRDQLIVLLESLIDR